MNAGFRIKKLIEITQKQNYEISDDCNLSVVYLVLIKNGSETPTLEECEKIINACGVTGEITPEELLNGSDREEMVFSEIMKKHKSKKRSVQKWK